MMTGESIAASVHPRTPDVAASRRIAAEALGSAFLLMAIVGSGIMAERLAGGNAALALLGNTMSTGAALVVLITIFGPLSGARDPAGDVRRLHGGAVRRRRRRRLSGTRDVRYADS
jgi:hypothetical protein